MRRNVAPKPFNVLAEAMEAHAEHLGRMQQYFDAEITTDEERSKDVKDDREAFTAWLAHVVGIFVGIIS